MLNNRGDKSEGQEESEYHFSDEEVNYEVETESPPSESAADNKKEMFKQLIKSKRVLISVGVFILLVIVAYSFLTPSSTSVPTDIIPVAAQQVKGPMEQLPPSSPVAQAPVPPPIPGTSPVSAAQQPSLPPPIAQQQLAQQPESPPLTAP